MRNISRLCVGIGLLFLSGCGNSEADRLTKANIRLTNEYAAEFERIATIPDKSELQKIQERITKIQDEMKSNNEALQKLPIAKLKELGDKHKTERDEANDRLKKAFAPFRAKGLNTKKVTEKI